MTLLNKEKLVNGFGKAIDKANGFADKTEEFVKEKELDKKAEAAVDKVDNFVKEKELDKKAEAAAHAVEKGLKKAGQEISNGINKIKN